MTATTAPLPTLRLGSAAIPVVLPSLRDPRLHLASVIISIHVLGQVALGFHVSIPQILVAIGACAVIEVAWNFVQRRQLVWPASAMLTGSGVALILRIIGTEHGDWWSTRGWHWFALVAGGSLLSKYLIRWNGVHVFNPSNLGLVVAFLLLGSTRAEPLDFWWAPIGPGMIAAYAVILVGGFAITARLGLFGMAAGFWLTLAGGMGILAASGHCITARWSFTPVCGAHFWWVIVTSPEILIFLFFMITDPKTVPTGRIGRVVFGSTVAIVCTLLIAPQQTEFGAKVALLGGLVIMCLVRPLVEHLLKPATRTRIVAFFTPPVAGGPRQVARAAVVAAGVVVAGAAIVAAGSPAREPLRQFQPVTLDELGATELSIDLSAIPEVTVDPDVADLDRHLAGDGAAELAVTLVETLEVEATALRTGDHDLLAAVDTRFRLAKMDKRIGADEVVVERYSLDSLHLTVVYPFGAQGGASPGLQASAMLEEITYDSAGTEVGRVSSACEEIVFAFVPSEADRWLLVDAGSFVDQLPARATRACTSA